MKTSYGMLSIIYQNSRVQKCIYIMIPLCNEDRDIRKYKWISLL